MATSDAPIEIGRLALTVNDIGKVSDFYQTAVGLHRLASDGETVTLGANGKPLLELRADPAARRRSPSARPASCWLSSRCPGTGRRHGRTPSYWPQRSPGRSCGRG